MNERGDITNIPIEIKGIMREYYKQFMPTNYIIQMKVPRKGQATKGDSSRKGVSKKIFSC